jgi:Flp pilus assembly protein TadD
VEKRSWFEAARRRVVLPVIAAMLAALAGGLAASPAQAERSIQIGGSKRTATVSVYIGKSDDARTDTSFVDITVGDPDVADVNPLTDRALSILGKKNGTTRVSVYAEGKKLIGVFDVGVIYDTSLLQTEIRAGFRSRASRCPPSMAASCSRAPRPTARPSTRPFDLAARAYAQAMRILGTTPELLDNQGFSYLMRGDYSRARATLLAAQSQAPDNPYIKNNIRLLQESQRRGKSVN